MSNLDLDWVTTEELVEYLMGRFDHAVFTGLHVTQNNEDGTGDNRAIHIWKGCGLTCAGLASEVQSRILQRRAIESEP